MNNTAPAAVYAKLFVPVTFRPFTRHALTLDVGSIVEVVSMDLADGLAEVEAHGVRAWVNLDDATPVEWDDVEGQWVEG